VGNITRHSSQDFCSALTSLRDSTTDGKTVLKGFDINAFHTWDEVMQCAKFAVERYHEEAKGPAGACRRTFRLVGDNAKALNPFVAFIPNDKYMSILCGGLKFLLNVILSFPLHGFFFELPPVKPAKQSCAFVHFSGRKSPRAVVLFSTQSFD
jgi:hypothetical protein